MSFVLALVAAPDTMNGTAALQRTLTHHDPMGDFLDGRYRFEIRGEYASGEGIVRTVELDFRHASMVDRYERARMYRDYLSYLWGLPMKLRDPGTRVDPVTKRVTFEGVR